MNRFEYAAPDTLAEALLLLADKPGSAPLAGGTDLLALMKDGIELPPRLVALGTIPDLRGVAPLSGGGVAIGAATTFDELLSDRRIASDYPALHTAAAGVRSQQLRHMRTLGGDLCRRPRCWYYRAGFGLLARRDGRSLVADGENRYHAILGNRGPARFVSPSVLAPPLIALGAALRVAGPNEKRELPLESFFRTPAAEGEREHDLAPGEIVLGVHLPARGALANATYEVRQRDGLDLPLATASVALEMDGTIVRSARVVLGQVAPVPWPAPGPGSVLAGKPVDGETAERAGDAAVIGARALSRNAYKIRLAAVAARRAILRAAGKEA